VTRRLTLEFPDAKAPQVAPWLAALEDSRRRTLDALEGVAEDDLVRTGPQSGNSIASLLYHIAAIEADWLFSEILESAKPFPAELFPFDVREEGGRLTPVTGMTLSEHLQRLASVRTLLLAELSGMEADELRRVRSLPDYDVAPDWVLHHLMQHEAEHRAQIAELTASAE
jgi:uncharacterized damage-inducible protein DinB